MPPTSDGPARSAKLTEWLDAARQGSSEALGEALEACRQYLLLVANEELDAGLRAKLGPSDVVQETFLEAQRDFGRFAGRTEAELLAWLRQILVNNLANVTRAYRDTQMRDVSREVPLAQVPAQELLGSAPFQTETPSAQASAREQAERVDRALGQLPEHYRDVIALRHQEKLSFEEIGQRMGRTAEAALKLWARAVEQLQQLLEPPHEPPG
jgi:RNA polymerase sigma-70 factor (ECF subfamily)